MVTDRDIRRKEYLLARARCNGDLNRAAEIKRELSGMRKELGQEDPPDEWKGTRKKKEKKVSQFIPCPCGCGGIPEGDGVFIPGHDGRVCGWIRKVERGKMKLDNLSKEVQKIYEVWVEQGRPGNQYHPRIKKIVVMIRG